jgi:hypothetical protein
MYHRKAVPLFDFAFFGWCIALTVSSAEAQTLTAEETVYTLTSYEDHSGLTLEEALAGQYAYPTTRFAFSIERISKNKGIYRDDRDVEMKCSIKPHVIRCKASNINEGWGFFSNYKATFKKIRANTHNAVFKASTYCRDSQCEGFLLQTWKGKVSIKSSKKR